MTEFDEEIGAFYDAACGRSLSLFDRKLVLWALPHFRYIFDDLVFNPEQLIYDLGTRPATNHVVFPCDVVELRAILNREEITCMGDNAWVPFFSIGFAERRLRRYPVFVIIDRRRMPSKCLGDYRGLVFYLGDLSGAIFRIQVNEPSAPGVVSEVRRIVGEESPGVEFVVSNSIPGISPPNPRLSNQQTTMKTINSLYYNIETGQVEDYSGGLEDLRNMHLRTPIDPKKTFLDDPLRMLRVARFSTKYDGASVDPDVISAMADADVHEAYKQKVHPGRASKELRKIFGSKNPADGARMLFETGLYKPVFDIPEDWHPVDMDQSTPHHEHNLMDHTLEVMRNYNNITSHADTPDEERMLMNMATFSHDLLKMHPDIRKPKQRKGETVTFQRGEETLPHMQYIGHDKEGAKFIEKAMKTMGFNSTEREFVSSIVGAHMIPHQFERNQMRPKDIGQFLNKTHKFYQKTLEHAEADALSKGGLTTEELQSIRDRRQQMREDIERYREEVGDLVHQPAIDGNYLRELASQIDPEMVSSNAMINHKDYGRPVHFMTYLNDRMLEKQWEKKIQSAEDAVKWADQAIRQFAALWRQQNNLPRLQGSPVTEDGINVIDGNEIMRLVPEIHPRTGFIQEVVDYLKAAGVADRATMEQKVLEWKQTNLSRYTQPDMGAQSMNWFKRVKKADASSASPPGVGEGFHRYEGGREWRELLNKIDKQRGRPEVGNDEVINMRRNPGPTKPLKGEGHAFEKDRCQDQTFINDVVNVPFQRGDKLRRRKKGLTHKQEFGKVVDITKEHLVIRWDGESDDEKIPLNETAYIANRIEKV